MKVGSLTLREEPGVPDDRCPRRSGHLAGVPRDAVRVRPDQKVVVMRDWEDTAKTCPGMDKGAHHTAEEVARIAADDGVP